MLTLFQITKFNIHSNLPFANKPFTCLQYKCFENDVGEEEIARYNQILLSQQCFLPLGELAVIVMKYKIGVCKIFQFGRFLKFVVWEQFKALAHGKIIVTQK